MVLYEILTGRKSMERNRPKEEQTLLDWVKHFPVDSKRFSSIIDPRLENQYSLSAAREIAKLADSCLGKSQKDRPKMSQVVERLKQIINTTDDGSPSNRSCSSNEIEMNDYERSPRETGDSGYARRRFEHLAKLGEHVEGLSKRRFMIMQNAKVS